MESALLWILVLPLLGAAVNGVAATASARLGRPLPRAFSAAVGCAGPTISFLLVLLLFRRMLGLPEGERLLEREVFRWIDAGSLTIHLRLLADPLGTVMALVVTGVGGLIHYYSIGYMAEDRGHARYFSFLNLFLFFMLLLILGDSLATLFVGWEGVGLCSYLLIGFWFEDRAKATAGKKAFLVNRIGDFGFLLGMLLLAVGFGGNGGVATLKISEIAARLHELPPGVIEGAALLLFLGATGKSAQIPLYVWLPDAMAGPTPVSALIHAATMVTAGVYMIARMEALYAAAPIASAVVLVVGAATALFAAVIGIAQTDIKKVLAYSTVSQLGYMMIGVGAGAFAAGIFHVFTHAFFKACLFLGAGSVIHALHHEQDIRRMGGLLKRMPLTGWTFLVSAAAIAGFPPLSGFFSKDEILFRAFTGANEAVPWAPRFAWILGTLAAVLTAFYMFRLFFLVFAGDARGEGAKHARESNGWFTVPLVILAAGAALAGFLGVPAALGGANRFEAFLASGGGSAAHGHGHFPAHPASHGAELGLMGLAAIIALAGTLLAWWLYRRDPERPARIAARFPAAYRTIRDKFYVDEVYYLLVVLPLTGISRRLLWRVVDVRFVDGLVNLTGHLTRGASFLVRFAQTGHAQTYGFVILAAVAALLWKVFSG
ncbi:MAG: NADH-quinone oxidoreductase subunit L [Candidatus Eisenbacteria bacterium]|nr:NADH-quinone oxidoreductase subunit L [Candidatus Eisenbacteria bacterium]